MFFAHTIEELYNPERSFTLSPDDIALLNPNTRTCPIFRSRKDAELTKAIYRRVPVLSREASDGSSEENPWGIRFRQGLFNMTSDSGLFRSRSDLEANGWRIAGNVFQKNGKEYLPLYEAKMIHHFDHRWASYSETDMEDVADDVPLRAKQSPTHTALPRHWVEAREVYLRCAELPKGLLNALRTRDTKLIVLGVVHLLFAHRLGQVSGGSARAVLSTLLAEWIEFVERHPLARRLAPTQMGLCGNNPGTLPANWMELSTAAVRQPPDAGILMHIAPGPGYLPARPVDDVEIGSRNITLWYAADETVVSDTLDLAAEYRHLFEHMLDVIDEDDALTCAERWLQQSTPRWLLGVRDITNSTNERTIVGGVFPLSAVGHNLPVWTASTRAREVLPALLSSLVCDFAARLKVGGTHLSFFIAKQIAILTPEILDRPVPWGHSGESVYDCLMPRILELTYGTWDLEPFASDCRWEGPPFRWEEERRFLLRCELDAMFLHLYLPASEYGEWQPPREVGGHSADETPEQFAALTHYFPTPRDAVGYILDTFPIVRRKDETRHGEYRTKRVILEVYDAMHTTAATGVPYRTVLDPPPADLSCCHPPQIAALDPASLADGEWIRPQGDQTSAETAVLAAVLKRAVGPAPIPKVRLTALLAMEPWLLTASLSSEEARDWRRLVGPEATALEAGTVPPRTLVNVGWGKAVRQLRGRGELIEDLAAGTWGPGPGLDRLDTKGWSDGRVGMVMEVLRRRNAEEIIRALPDSYRDWINAEAA